MNRTYAVTGPNGTKVYNGFDMYGSGAWYELRIGEQGPFYCGRNLDIAVCELTRYGKEQYDWNLEVRVRVLPGHNGV